MILEDCAEGHAIGAWRCRVACSGCWGAAERRPVARAAEAFDGVPPATSSLGSLFDPGD